MTSLGLAAATHDNAAGAAAAAGGGSAGGLGSAAGTGAAPVRGTRSSGFDEAAHPRASAGAAGGGRFVAASSGSSGSSSKKTKKGKAAGRRVSELSDRDLQTVAHAAHSSTSNDPRIATLRHRATQEMRRRGHDTSNLGASAGRIAASHGLVLAKKTPPFTDPKSGTTTVSSEDAKDPRVKAMADKLIARGFVAERAWKVATAVIRRGKGAKGAQTATAQPAGTDQLALTRHVRTAGGVQRFHLPIGSPIVGGGGRDLGGGQSRAARIAGRLASNDQGKRRATLAGLGDSDIRALHTTLSKGMTRKDLHDDVAAEHKKRGLDKPGVAAPSEGGKHRTPDAAPTKGETPQEARVRRGREAAAQSTAPKVTAADKAPTEERLTRLERVAPGVAKNRREQIAEHEAKGTLTADKLRVMNNTIDKDIRDNKPQSRKASDADLVDFDRTPKADPTTARVMAGTDERLRRAAAVRTGEAPGSAGDHASKVVAIDGAKARRAQLSKLTAAQLSSVDAEFARRARLLGKAGKVSSAHKQVKAELARRRVTTAHPATGVTVPVRAVLSLAQLPLDDSSSGPKVVVNSASRTGRGKTKTKLDAKSRKKMAMDGTALKDGSFPVRNRQDLLNAVKALPRANDTKKPMVKRHIAKRARALGVKLPAKTAA